ncbi:MAG: hypothetical protein ACRD0Q_00970 [Acidimicrobiales bacterium]
MPDAPPSSAPRPAPKPPRPAAMVLTALGAVVIGLLLFAVVTRVMSTQTVRRAATAPREFDVGPADQRAKAIARDRTPLLFPDPLDRAREIYVQHLGGDRWVAFEARAPGAAQRCVVRWRVTEGDFVDPCNGTVYPADGAGLASYPARVDGNGRLLVDLRAPRPPASPPESSPPGATATSVPV